MTISLLDFKLGFRMLRKHPVLTVVGGFAMAVAIAIGAGFFEFMNGMFLHPTLPLPGGDRIVGIMNWDTASASYDRRAFHDFATWRHELRTIEDVGAALRYPTNLIAADGRVEPALGAAVSASMFRLTRVPPLLGRTLVEADEEAAAPAVVVLGYDLWQNRFGGDTAVVGRNLQVGGSMRTVVGVMPEGFVFPANRDLWVPLPAGSAGYEARQGPRIRIAGRLADGVSLEEAQAEIGAVGTRMTATFPDSHEHLRLRVLPYVDSLLLADDPQFKLALWGMQVFLLLILVIASVNVATMVFARTAAREGEIVIRHALGAGRGRIVAQLFVESLVLASAAAVVGLAAAKGLLVWGIRILENTGALGGGIPFWWNGRMSPRTFVFVGLMVVFSAAVTGILPALKATGRRAQNALQQVGSAGSPLRFGFLSTALVVTQVAVSVGLLTYALDHGQRTFEASAAEVGFPAEDFLAARLRLDWEPSPELPGDAGPAASSARFERLCRDLARRLEAEPGVSGVTFANALPGMFAPERRAEVEGLEAAPGSQGYRVNHVHVDPDFFTVLETPVLSGRTFTLADVEVQGTVMVNRSFVSQVLRDGSTIGRRLRFVDVTSEETGPWYEIVGVVEDTIKDPDLQSLGAMVYQSAAPGSTDRVHMVVRVADPDPFTPSLRRVTAEVDPTVQLHDVKPLAEIIAGAQVQTRFLFLLSSLVTAMVLLLATFGTYALMWFIVSQRTREIGIRVALGADGPRVLAAIFSRALIQLGLGVAVGLWAFVGLGGFELTAGGFGLLLTVAATVVLAGFIACLVPARRGLRIQPNVVLKET